MTMVQQEPEVARIVMCILMLAHQNRRTVVSVVRVVGRRGQMESNAPAIAIKAIVSVNKHIRVVAMMHRVTVRKHLND